MPSQKNNTSSENGKKLIIREPLLPNYSNEIDKTPVEQQYLNANGEILLPMAGNVTNGKFKTQTAEEGFLTLAADLARHSGSLAGRKFPSDSGSLWHTQLRTALSNKLKKEYPGKTIDKMDNDQLSSLVEGIIDTFSVKDDTGQSFGFLEGNDLKKELVEAAVTRAEGTKNPSDSLLHDPAGNMLDAISTVLTIGFTKGLLQQCTGATDDAINSLALHYDQNIIQGHAYNLVRNRLSTECPDDFIYHVHVNGDGGNLDIRFVTEGNEQHYFDLVSRVSFLYGFPTGIHQNTDDRQPVQDAIESTLKLVPGENRVRLIKSACFNPTGLAASIYLGGDEHSLVGYKLQPKLEQKVKEEHKQAYQVEMALCKKLLSKYKKRALISVLEETKKGTAKETVKSIQDNVATYTDLLSAIEKSFVSSDSKEDNGFKNLPEHETMYYYQHNTNVLRQCNANLKSAIDSGTVPTSNKVLGGFLIAVGVVLGLTTLTAIVLTTVALTGGAAAIPLVGGAIAAATSALIGSGVATTASIATISFSIAVAKGILAGLAGYLGFEKIAQKEDYDILKGAPTLGAVGADIPEVDGALAADINDDASSNNSDIESSNTSKRISSSSETGSPVMNVGKNPNTMFRVRQDSREEESGATYEGSYTP